jgi:Domain of unknown function (DUF5658)
MSALTKSLLLFLLNWIDAQLTLLWIHSDLASEGNGLMSQLIQIGDWPFLLVKLAIGAFAAITLYRCSDRALARHGMQLVLTIYGLLMMAHVATGLSALGWSRPLAMLTYVTNVPYALITLFS